MTEKKKQGFAAMSPERVREISSKGGKAVPPEKRIFSVNRVLASQSGRKGGMFRNTLTLKKEKTNEPET